MTLQKEHFKKILIERDVHFLRCDVLADRNFKVQLTNGLSVYQGSVSSDDFKNMASKVEMEVDKFEGLFGKCFCIVSSDIQFVYGLKETENGKTWEFSWKQILEDGLKFQLGSLMLRKSEDAGRCILSSFELLTGRLALLSEKVMELEQKNDAMSREQEEMTRRLEVYAVSKASLEEDLYTKFSHVLNSKKAKIRELKKQQGRTIPQTKTATDMKVTPPDADQCSESDHVDTDDEKEFNRQKRKHEEADVAHEERESVRSEGGDHLVLDDSLEFDDDMPSKSRKRLRAARPKTPVSPIIPRTTSIPRPKPQSSQSDKTKVINVELDTDSLYQSIAVGITDISRVKSTAKRQISREVSVDDLLDEL